MNFVQRLITLIYRFSPKTQGARFVRLLAVFSVSVFVCIVLTLLILDKSDAKVIYVYFAMLTCYTLSIYCFIKYLRVTTKEVEENTSNVYLKELDDLSAIRTDLIKKKIDELYSIQDYLNNEKYGEIEKYLTNRIDRTSEFDKRLKVKNIAIENLLQKKGAICSQKGIKLIFNLNSKEQFNFLETKDMIGLFGNLLDNAIAASEKMCTKIIKVDWSESSLTETLVVRNTSEKIEKVKLSKMFDLDYTTKIGEAGGTGLSIVQSIVKKYRGKLYVDSSSGITSFTVIIPKSKVS